MTAQPLCPFFLVAATAAVASGFLAPSPQFIAPRNSPSLLLGMTARTSPPSEHDEPRGAASSSRRTFLHESLLLPSTALILTAATAASSPANAVERAVGSSELACREAGNCVEVGDWDGAVGWNWGGRDRCDATDPRCGPDGRMLDAPPTGEGVPAVPSGVSITHVVEMELNIGKTERATLRMGLYGESCPQSVRQMLDFCTSDRLGGLTTTSKLLLEEGYGAISVPVALGRGGTLNVVYPNQRLDFGVPSQAGAYARSKNLNKAGEGFIPQPRPSNKDGVLDALDSEPFVRKHDVAGLVSLPKSGLGYGGSGFESEDEAYGSAFQITAGMGKPVQSMDREGRRVVGQLMDGESMATLARLASLPTRKGLKGVIPGQNAGPPLLRVTVGSVSSSVVVGSTTNDS